MKRPGVRRGNSLVEHVLRFLAFALRVLAIDGLRASDGDDQLEPENMHILNFTMSLGDIDGQAVASFEPTVLDEGNGSFDQSSQATFKLSTTSRILDTKGSVDHRNESAVSSDRMNITESIPFDDNDPYYDAANTRLKPSNAGMEGFANSSDLKHLVGFRPLDLDLAVTHGSFIDRSNLTFRSSEIDTRKSASDFDKQHLNEGLLCPTDPVLGRVGCSRGCLCDWFESCFSRRMKTDDKAWVQSGICSLSLVWLILLSLIIILSILGLTVMSRIIIQYRDHHLELQKQQELEDQESTAEEES